MCKQGAYYRFAASRLGPYFQRRSADLNIVFLRIAASAIGASCVFQCKFATVYGFYVAVAASAEITVCGKGLQFTPKCIEKSSTSNI